MLRPGQTPLGGDWRREYRHLFLRVVESRCRHGFDALGKADPDCGNPRSVGSIPGGERFAWLKREAALDEAIASHFLQRLAGLKSQAFVTKSLRG